MGNLIMIQNATATQITKEWGKGLWVVNSEKGDPLYELPKHFSEKDTMAAIHFVRKFELIAFNTWIDFKNAKNQEAFDNERKAYKEQITQLTLANERLAEKLWKFI